MCLLNRFSRVWLFVAPWTVARQALCPWDFPGKNTEMGCHFLLQGNFPMQGSNPSLSTSPALAGGSLPLVPPGKPNSTDVFKSTELFTLNGWTIQYMNYSSIKLLKKKANIFLLFIFSSRCPNNKLTTFHCFLFPSRFSDSFFFFFNSQYWGIKSWIIRLWLDSKGLGFLKSQET